MKKEVQQLSMLNTNSRYMHDNIVRLAAEIAEAMPDPLSVCIFVNSGSEANDLALRLARAYTNRRDVYCVNGAYHGNSAATLAISPYNKYADVEVPDGSVVLTCPDTYRLGWTDEQTTRFCADEFERLMDSRGAEGGASRPPAAFIVESLICCGGQVGLRLRSPSPHRPSPSRAGPRRLAPSLAFANLRSPSLGRWCCRRGTWPRCTGSCVRAAASPSPTRSRSARRPRGLPRMCTVPCIPSWAASHVPMLMCMACASPGRLRPRGLPLLGLRGARRHPRHRDARQADGQWPEPITLILCVHAGCMLTTS